MFTGEIDAYILSHIDEEGDLLSALNRDANVNLLRPRMLSGHLQGRIFHDKILHLVIDLDRMDQRPLFHAFRHTQSGIRRISPDLQDSSRTNHPAKHLQYPTLQMPG